MNYFSLIQYYLARFLIDSFRNNLILRENVYDICNLPLDLLDEKYLVTGYKSLWAKYGLDFQSFLDECHAKPKRLLTGIPYRRNSQPKMMKSSKILKMAQCFSIEFGHNMW